MYENTVFAWLFDCCEQQFDDQFSGDPVDDLDDDAYAAAQDAF